MKFQDKVVIVTGGASGIGEASVLKFSELGAKLVIADISDSGQALADKLVRNGHQAIFIKTDVTSEKDAKIPPAYAHLGSLEFAKRLLAEAKVCVSPGIGFGDYGDTHVRFALIENQDRIRQAVRGIKAMFRADGLLPTKKTTGE